MEVRCKHKYSGGDLILDISKPYEFKRDIAIEMTAVTGFMKLTDQDTAYTEYDDTPRDFIADISYENFKILIEVAKFNESFEEKLLD